MDIKKRQIIKKIKTSFFYVLLKISGLIVPKKNNLWVFGSRKGERFEDNPKYLFKYVVENCPDIEAVWITSDKNVLSEVIKSGGKVYLSNSVKALWNGLRAKVYIYNIGIKDVVNYSCRNAVFINLWHGMPIKSLKGDQREKKSYSKLRQIERRVVRSLTTDTISGEQTDLFIATSKSSQEKLFESNSCKNIQITGQPRDDIFYKKINKHLLFDKMNLNEYRDKFIITYLPTFRDNVRNYKSKFAENINEFHKLFNENPNIVVLEKSHFNEKENVKKEKQVDKNYRNISDMPIDTQELMYITDILITDYSSVYIDYLHLNRPVIFYAYDLEEYKINRGLLYEYNDVACGQIACNIETVISSIKKYYSDSEIDNEKRMKVTKLFHQNLDGKYSERVVKEINKLIK